MSSLNLLDKMLMNVCDAFSNCCVVWLSSLDSLDLYECEDQGRQQEKKEGILFIKPIRFGRESFTSLLSDRTINP
ncbi:CLUMA_CG010367, isoform A [Clunio marinus]|uniref:CLUMA_CG010367, isoform A n=1 Tax=Clunio marinus TaxID=568069 RepID=A0A1J1IBI7_9DIPT|nr:CLUMA_CG010367, isoform A [Clunio marinus]